jgi:hypothetical protein
MRVSGAARPAYPPALASAGPAGAAASLVVSAGEAAVVSAVISSPASLAAVVGQDRDDDFVHLLQMSDRRIEDAVRFEQLRDHFKADTFGGRSAHSCLMTRKAAAILWLFSICWFVSELTCSALLKGALLVMPDVMVNRVEQAVQKSSFLVEQRYESSNSSCSS